MEKGIISLVLVVVVLSMFPLNYGGNGRRGTGGLLFVAGSSGSVTFGSGGGRGGGFWATVAPSNVGIAVAVTAMAGIALVATVVYSRR